MSRYYNRSARKIGLPPGTIIHTGDRKTETPRITLIEYDVVNYREERAESLDQALPVKAAPTVTWINIDGLHDLHMMDAIGKRFHIHPLTLEDILNTGQRPKVEEFDSYLFLVLQMLIHDDKTGKVASEQISFILGDSFLISFQEIEGDLFHAVRERIRKTKGRIRTMGPDYLFYALLDAVVDHYFLVLERFGGTIESLETQIAGKPDASLIVGLHSLKREMIFLRKQLWPLRDVLGKLTKNDIARIGDQTSLYLRDVHDHTIQIIDGIETLRDLVTGMQEIYLSTQSNHLNEVMKVLTMISTLFIPMSFVAGVYGMNFKYMPELEWRWGYPLFWAVIAILISGMFVYFRKKKWF